MSIPPLRLREADGLARAVEARGSVPVAEAAAVLLAIPDGQGTIARAVLDDVVARDVRLCRRGDEIRLGPVPRLDQRLELTRFCVLDIETTGLVPGVSQIREVGAVLLDAGEVVDELELAPPSSDSGELVSPLLDFAGDSVLAGHNLRFDLAFIDREAAIVSGGRIAASVVDTLVLARRLLGTRTPARNLAALAEFIGSASRPCHRALPDARATAEILLFLIEVARDGGARLVADLCSLCA